MTEGRHNDCGEKVVERASKVVENNCQVVENFFLVVDKNWKAGTFHFLNRNWNDNRNSMTPHKLKDLSRFVPCSASSQPF